MRRFVEPPRAAQSDEYYPLFYSGALLVDLITYLCF
jgi:hypothetical protein